MAKARETTTDYDVNNGELPEIDLVKKPDWVNLAPLDGIHNDNLLDKFLYKPALRFHGLTGGLWGQGLAGSPSVITDSRPPSYQVKDPLASRYSPTALDQGSVYNTNIPAISRVTLRRRNTLAVVLVAAALLTSIAAITGIVLHFIQPKSLLRANVRFTVANENYTSEMMNSSSPAFIKIARSLCGEMDLYYLTSGLADFYLGCNVISLSKDEETDNVAVHYTLDFLDNKVTNDKENIRKVILNKAGRHETNETLFLVIDDFWVYLRSLKIDLDHVPYDRKPRRPRIPWRNDLDFITRESNNVDVDYISLFVPLTKYSSSVVLTTSFTNPPFVPRHVLPGVNQVLPRITNHAINIALPFTDTRKALIIPSDVLSRHYMSVITHDHSRSLSHLNQQNELHVRPTQTKTRISTWHVDASKSTAYPFNMQEFDAAQNRDQDNNEYYMQQNIHDFTFLNDEVVPFIIKDETQINRNPIHIDTSFQMAFSSPSDGLTDVLNNLNDKSKIKNENVIKKSFKDKRVLTIDSDVFIIGGNAKTLMDFQEYTTSQTSLETNGEFYNHDIFKDYNHNTIERFRNGGTSDVSSFKLSSIDSQQNPFQNTPHETNSRIYAFRSQITRGKDNSLNHFEEFSKVSTIYSANTSVELTSSHILSNSQSSVTSLGHIVELNEMVANDLIQISLPDKQRISNEVNIPVDDIMSDEENIEWINVLNIQSQLDETTSYTPTASVNNSVGIDTFNKSKNTIDDILRDFFPSNIYSLSERNVTKDDIYVPSFVSSSDYIISTSIEPNIMRPTTDTTPHSDITLDNKSVNTVYSLSSRSDIRLDNTNYYTETYLESPTQQRTVSTTDNLQFFFKKVYLPKYYDKRISNYQRVGRRADRRLRNMIANNEHHLDNIIAENDDLVNRRSFKAGSFLRTNDRHLPNTLGHSRKRESRNYWKKYMYTPRVETLSNMYHSSINKYSRRYKEPNVISDKYNTIKMYWWTPKYFYFVTYVDDNYFQKDNLPFFVVNYRHSYSDSIVPYHRKWYGKPSFERTFPKTKEYYKSWNNQNYDSVFHKQANPLRQRSNNRAGFTKSYNVSDIYEMKSILKQLIDSMQNMSHKIDKMQIAINLINQTLHETKQPMHKLEHTFENMTKSFDNFNRNLNDIRDVLSDFKNFLKPFDKTIFNVDEIINHIDKTVDNLEKTRQFVGVSMNDLGETVKDVTGSLFDLNNSLSHVNMSVFHVNNTAKYTNKTLNSMGKTLQSLDLAIRNMNRKIDKVIGGVDGINVSLTFINNTVKSSQERLSSLQNRILNMNSTMKRIEDTVLKHNQTYQRIMHTLDNMNEPVMITKGTVLEVIDQLSNVDDELFNISLHMSKVNSELELINGSLISTLMWMKHMFQALEKFNVSIDTVNDDMTFNLNSIDIVDAVGILLKINSTLHIVGKNIDLNDINIDAAEGTLNHLELNLNQLDQLLSSINDTFTLLNDTLKGLNSTLIDIKQPLKSIEENVNRVEYSFRDLNETFDNIDQTLAIANETLRKVGKTNKGIDTRLDQIGGTLNQTQKAVQIFNNTVISLNSSLNSIEGPLEKIKEDLNNRNRTLRAMKEKLNKTISSFEVSKENLYGIEDTIDGILNKLNETGGALNRTKISLLDVNNTITAIEDINEEMNIMLNNLYTRFNSTQDSLTSFGSAFPTLQGKMLETALTIRQANNQIKQIHKNLNETYKQRNTSTQSYLEIKHLFKEVLESVLNEKEDLLEALDFADEVESDILSLIKTVKSTERNHQKLDKNVNLLSQTFPKLKEGFDVIISDSNALDKESVETADVVISLNKLYKEIALNLENYPSISMPNDIYLNIVSIVDNLDNSKNLKDVWDIKLMNASKNVWNERGYPLNIHGNFDVILENSIKLNKTMDEFAAFMTDMTNTLDDISLANKTIRRQLKHINETFKKIDEIRDLNQNIEQDVTQLEISVEKNNNELKKAKQILRDKINFYEDIKRQFGDIHGTLNSSDIYGEIDDMLDTMEAHLRTLVSISRNATHLFHESKLIYDLTNQEFQATPITIDNDGDAHMSQTYNSLVEIDDTLNAVHDELSSFDNNNITFYDYIDQLDNHTKHIIELLQNKSNSFDFKQKNKPALVDSFVEVNTFFENISYKFDSLFSRFEQINNMAYKIRSLSGNISNVDMSIIEDQRLLDNLYNTVIKFKAELNADLNTYNSTLKEFELFDQNPQPFETLREEYAKYDQILNHINKTIATTDIEMSVVNRRLDDIEQYFKRDIDSLEKYFKSMTTLKRLKSDFQMLSEHFNETENKLALKTDDVRDINNKLEALKATFSNFSAASFNVSDLFINFEVKQLLKDFNKIVKDLSILQADKNSLRMKLDDLLQTLTSAPFNRFNIMRVLDNDIIPESGRVDSYMKNTRSVLNQLKTRLDELDTDMNFLNDSLQITEDRLSLDMQKKLIADMKFPHLEQSFSDMNALLKKINISLEYPYELLKDSNDSLNVVFDEINSIPTLKLNKNVYMNNLKSSLETIKNIEQEINEIASFISSINETIWVGNGTRYLHNESIKDIRMRYSNAMEQLASKRRQLEKLAEDISDTNKYLLNISSDIDVLNKSVEEFKNITDGMNNISDKIDLTADSLKTSKNDIQTIADSLTSLDIKLNNTVERFSSINAQKLDKELGPVQLNVSLTKDGLKDLLKSSNTVRERFDILNQNIQNINATKYEDIYDESQLKNINEIVSISLDNYLAEVDLINSRRKFMDKKFSPLKTKIEETNSSLISAEYELKRHEKLDFYRSSFPKDLYDEVGRKLEKLYFKNENLKGVLDIAETSLKKLKNIQSMNENVNISLQSELYMIDLLNKIYKDNTLNIEQMREKHANAYNLFFAEDGLEISDNETLDQLKDRHNKLTSSLSDINDFMLPINASLDKGMFGEVEKQTKDMIKMIRAIENLRSYTDMIKTYGEKLNYAETLLQSAKAKHIESYNTTNSFKEEINKYQSEFPDIENTMIIAKKDKINQLISELTLSLQATSLQIANDENDYNLMQSLISEKLVRSTLGFNTFSEIESYLNDSNAVKHIIQKHLLNIDQSLLNSINRLKDDDPIINAIQSELDSLKRLLLHQEKLDYINENAPSLLQKLQSLNDTAYHIQENIEASHGNMFLVKNFKDLIENKLMKDDKVMIRLENISSILNTTKELTKNVEEGISSLHIDLDSIDERMFNKNSDIIFGDLITIKEKYQTVNRTLNDGDLFSMNSTHNIATANEQIENIKSYLSQVYKELLNRDNIKSRLNILENKNNISNEIVDNVSTHLTRVQGEIDNIDISTHTLAGRFAGVDDPSLVQEIATLKAESNALLQSILNAKEHFKTINDIKMKANTDIYQVKDTLNSESHTNEDLTLLNIYTSNTLETINITLSDLDDELYYFDTSISNFKNESDIISNRLGILESKLFQNQKENYVNESLPYVQKAVDNYEKLLENLFYEIENATNVYFNTTKEIQNTKYNAEIKGLDLQLSDVNPKRFEMKKKLAEASDQYDSMKNNLNSFLKSINPHVGSNDTLFSIKDRLSRYNETIESFFKDTLPIFNMTNEVQTISQEAINLIDEYNTQLKRLKKANNDIEKQNLSIDKVKDNTNLLSHKLNKTNQDISYLQTKLKYIEDKYTTVNSSYLENMKSMLNSTVLELKDKQNRLDKLLNDELNNLLGTATSKLYNATSTNITTIENIQQMKAHAIGLDKIRQDVGDNINVLEDEIAHLLNISIPKHEQVIRDTRKTISKLLTSYKDENKNDYIQAHLPAIMSSYFATNQTLLKQIDTIDELELNMMHINQTIDNFEIRLDNFSNVFLTLNDFKLDLKSGKENIEYLSSILKSKSYQISNIDIRHLSPEYLQTLPLNRIKHLFSNIKDTLNETTETLTFTENKVRILNESTIANDQSLRKMNELLDRFLNNRDMSIDAKYNLLSLYESISKTSNTFNSVKSHLHNKMTRFNKLKNVYPNVTNQIIQNLLDTANSHINSVEMRLPLLNELFETNSITGFENLNKSLIKVHNNLSSQFIPDRDTLQEVVSSSGNSLLKILKQMKHLENNDNHYRDDALQLYKQITGFDSILDELEQSFITQKKNDLLKKNIPILKEKLLKLKNDTLREDDILFDLENTWNVLNESYKYLQTEIRDNPSLRISLDTQFLDLNNTKKDVNDLSESIIGVLHNINEIPIFNLSLNDIISNVNYSVDDVEEIINNIERPLDDLSVAIDKIISNNSKVAGTISTLTNYSKVLEKILKEYALTENKLINFTADFNDILSKQNSVETNLNSATTTIHTLKADLRKTISDFKAYSPDGSQFENTINDSEKKLLQLEKRFEVVINKILDINNTFVDMNGSLYEPVINVLGLKEVLNSIHKNHTIATTTLSGVNNTLDDILRETELLDIDFENLKNDILEFNSSLATEDKKTHYIKATLPVLKKKYKETKFSFNVMNKTFEEMEDKLVMLEKFVSQIKSKMMNYENINISLANVTVNLTDMESRLLNMQDHYDNIKEIVSNLKNDLNKSADFGNDVSFENVTYMFSSYNLSIDKVDMVLGKIDMEFTEMDNQFATMNDTLLELDTALDQYAQSDIEVNILNDELSEISNLIHNKDTKLLDLKTRVHELNGTFENLQNIYKDVVNTTATKNLIFKDTLSNASNLIRNIKDVLLKKLQVNKKGAEEKFNAMNITFNNDVRKPSELSDLLSKVELSQDRLKFSLDYINDEMVTAKNHTNDLQSLLGDVAGLLSEINATLQSEQAKHDYIKNNMFSFKDQLKEIQEKFTLAKSSLNATDDSVQNTLNYFNKIQVRLFNNQNTNFSMDEESLNAIQNELSALELNYLDFDKTFKDLKLDISNSDDINSNMSELSSRYLRLNQTMQILYDGLDGLIKNISYENLQLDPIGQQTNFVDQHLDSFDRAISQTGDIKSNITTIEESVISVESETNAISANLDHAGEDLNKMSKIYKNVSTEKGKALKYELQNLFKEYVKEANSFQNINNTLEKFKDNLLLAKNDLHFIETNLKTTFKGFDKFRTALNLSENVISKVLPDIEILHIDINTLQGDSNIMLDSVIDLRERINSLNESLFEEMSKQQFITNNYGHVENKFNLIKTRLDMTNESIFEAFERTTDLNNYLNTVSTKLDKFSAINMSLDSEQISINDERGKLEELMNLFNNVSITHSKLPLGDMKNTNKTFLEVRADYDEFEKALQRLDDHLTHAVTDVTDTNSRLDALNSTLSDISETADNYEKMKNIISDQIDKSTQANAALNHTKFVAIELETQIKSLNKTLLGLENSFKQINDSSLEAAKSDLEQLLKMFTDELNGLKHSNNELEDLSTVLQDRLGSINDTLYSTKEMIGKLKAHITFVNETSVLVDDGLNNMNLKQKLANSTAKDLKPRLDRVFKDLENLTSAFNREQQKLDFLEREKPVLQSEYESLEALFSDINRRISMTDFHLADLKYAIKTTDSRLDKLQTFNISTDPEMLQWTDHYETVSNLSSKFLRLSSTYNLLQDDIHQLDRKNKTEKQLKAKIKTIKISLQDIKQALSNKNKTLGIIEEGISEIESVLDGFDVTMKEFRTLLVNGTNAKELMQRSLESITNTTIALSEITDLEKSILDSISYIQIKYKSISDKNLVQKLSMYKQITSKEAKRLKLNDANLRDINKVMKITTAAFNKTYIDLNEQELNRKNVHDSMEKIDRGLRTAKSTFVDTAEGINSIDTVFSSIRKIFLSTLSDIKELNKTLHLEWQKATFVSANLPKLQEKLVSINKTFTKNIPMARDLKSQISYLTILLEKIEDKMLAYNIEDTDNSVTEWRNDIETLNRTIREINAKNRNSDQVLTDLRSKLWSDSPMYTKIELLNDVERRFADFNKTLDGIEVETVSINLQLDNLDTNSTRMAIDMENRDLVLTTTTTPAAPPDWLSFTSSGSGVIAQDKGYLECSAKDLTNWEIMKITRVHPDGNEQDIAAWKLGVGARKPRTLRDRRIRVKRLLDGQGAGKLQINITSVQCVDEAKYFCSIDSHSMWPLQTDISVINPPEDSLEPEFPTEVFEDKVANFSCTGHPGYPNGRIIWKIRRANEAFFKDFDFYSARSKVVDEQCTRTETNTVGYQFDMHWNSTRIRCYIEGTDYYGEGIIRILPYSICNKVRDLGKIRHPYTPHKYIVCDRGLNIMQCPGKTCYDQTEGNCVQCKASDTGGDPCRGQPPFSFVAHETDCKKYYICMGNTKSIKRCAKGYFSSAVRGACTLTYAQSDCAKKKG